MEYAGHGMSFVRLQCTMSLSLVYDSLPLMPTRGTERGLTYMDAADLSPCSTTPPSADTAS